MVKKDRKPKAKPPGEKWVVYMLRCADGSLYTGIAKDVIRRRQQHNAGTASRYTRSRLPVRLVYQECHASRSLALKREAAIKALDRRGKLTMVQQRKKPAKTVRQIAHLEDIPNIGPSIAAALRHLGITTPAELPGRVSFCDARRTVPHYRPAPRPVPSRHFHRRSPVHGGSAEEAVVEIHGGTKTRDGRTSKNRE